MDLNDCGPGTIVIGWGPTKVEAEVKKLWAETDLALVRAESERIDLARKMSVDGEGDVFTLYDVVNSKSVWNWMGTISQWSRRFPGRGLTLVICSPGGSVVDGLAFYDFIQTVKINHTVTTKAVGMAASMGSVLLQMGHARVAGPNSFMLIHEGSMDAGGSIGQVEDSIKFGERLRGKIITILAARSTLTEDEIRNRWERRDWWLDAEEMLQLGFVDAIG